MKKKIVASLLVAAVAFSMATCGSKDNGGAAADTKEPAASAEREETADSAEPEKTPASASSDSEIKSTGPHGEQGVSADTITLTDDQIAQIKEGGYKVAIVFHYGGNDWATAQQQGIEDTCEELGMEVVAVTNADFSAEQQVSDIETKFGIQKGRN